VGTPVDDTARLLERLRAGDPEAAEALFSILYEDLRRIAGRLFRSRGVAHTLEPTALVHEAYLKMAGGGGAGAYADRAHVLAVAARAMRQVLANHARDRTARKRGGGTPRDRVTLAGVAGPAGSAVDAVAFHEALDRLAGLDDRQARIAEMRLLGGLSIEEIAVLLGVSTRTVELDWRMAKRALAAWLAPATEGGSP
jgi:RNA polymerase sigma-70 factor (ECF subfamily)